MCQNGMIKYLNKLFMKNTIIFLYCLILVCFITSCTSKTENRQGSISSTNSYSTSSSNDDDADDSEETNKYSVDCKFEDGTYSATVDYNNPETGYSATYTLDVEVQDCQVVQINFPNDGYLDEDHISYADIDENGNATVDGEDGKTYEIQIDN